MIPIAQPATQLLILFLYAYALQAITNQTLVLILVLNA